jgi:hypothetical protein
MLDIAIDCPGGRAGKSRRDEWQTDDGAALGSEAR